MKSRATPSFWRAYDALPRDVQEAAVRAYHLWLQSPSHPGLMFKRVRASQALYSVRIGLAHRALGLLEGDTMTWLWIGNHAEYDRILR